MKLGYRLFGKFKNKCLYLKKIKYLKNKLYDTAQVYKNEADLGICFEALLPKYKLERSQIFIITKIGFNLNSKIDLFFCF